MMTNFFMFPLYIIMGLVGLVVSMMTLLTGLYFIGTDYEKNKRQALGRLYVDNRLLEIILGFILMYLGILGLEFMVVVSR